MIINPLGLTGQFFVLLILRGTHMMCNTCYKFSLYYVCTSQASMYGLSIDYFHYRLALYYIFVIILYLCDCLNFIVVILLYQLSN